jgi:hypothetical protein
LFEGFIFDIKSDRERENRWKTGNKNSLFIERLVSLKAKIILPLRIIKKCIYLEIKA